MPHHPFIPTMFPSRADVTGVKPKVLLARTKKSLIFHREALSKLALPYADVDNSVAGALDDLLAAFDTFSSHVIATAEWLAEPLDT